TIVEESLPHRGALLNDVLDRTALSLKFDALPKVDILAIDRRSQLSLTVMYLDRPPTTVVSSKNAHGSADNCIYNMKENCKVPATRSAPLTRNKVPVRLLSLGRILPPGGRILVCISPVM